MAKERLVIALGGNALGNNPEEQKALIAQHIAPIADLILAGHEVVITHGNGPQVGMINLAFEHSADPKMPFPECGAMSQGYIGYHLQNALNNAFIAAGSRDRAVSLVTQVVVETQDPAFENPTKPIGRFYTEAEAEALAAASGQIYREDAGRGWRRVVPSPQPVDIVEKEAIRHLSGGGFTVIASGGGGIPVIKTESGYVGTAAVIDKDHAAALLAAQLDYDTLLILTAVDRVAIRFNQPDVAWLSSLTLAEAEQYIAEGHFAKGSMLPKVQAAMRFAASRPGRKAIITSLEQVAAALRAETGTVITA